MSKRALRALAAGGATSLAIVGVASFVFWRNMLDISTWDPVGRWFLASFTIVIGACAWFHPGNSK